MLESYEAKHQQSQSLAERGRGLFPTGITHDARAFWPWPIYVERAQGARKWDAGGEVERAEAATTRLVRGLNELFEELSAPGSAWAVASMWHLNLGYDAPRPRDVAWDAAELPRGVDGELLRPLRWALYNHGVDLMGTGGMVSSAHADADIDHTLEAFRAAVGELRAEQLLG